MCLLGSAIGYVSMGIGGALWVLFLGRMIDGLTGGNFSILYAYVGDISKVADISSTRCNHTYSRLHDDPDSTTSFSSTQSNGQHSISGAERDQGGDRERDEILPDLR